MPAEDGFTKVDVIGHRGASGWMPDHTLPTYQKAFEKGADWLELDAHCTSDGHLVVNHDIELHETTDVADWEWAATRRTRVRAPCADGESDVEEGWMVPHFTLEELKRLRVKMRPFIGRDHSFDLQFEIPTVRETADLLARLVSEIKSTTRRSYSKEEWLAARNKYVLDHGHARANLRCGLYIETKRPAWYRSLGLPVSFVLVSGGSSLALSLSLSLLSFPFSASFSFFPSLLVYCLRRQRCLLPASSSHLTLRNTKYKIQCCSWKNAS